VVLVVDDAPKVNSVSIPSLVVDERAAARRSFWLVFLCTLIGAGAQMLIKKGAGALQLHVTLPDVVRDPTLIFRYAFGIITNPLLFVGYAMYGVNTLLMAAALKGRELSLLFPIIALTYVWVSILSVTLLGEQMNWFRGGGIALIVVGVSILGWRETTVDA
jgi:drug/metabolite transporter (DMT)-like permease